MIDKLPYCDPDIDICTFQLVPISFGNTTKIKVLVNVQLKSAVLTAYEGK